MKFSVNNGIKLRKNVNRCEFYAQHVDQFYINQSM